MMSDRTNAQAPKYQTDYALNGASVYH